MTFFARQQPAALHAAMVKTMTDAAPICEAARRREEAASRRRGLLGEKLED